jgi:hypothetical protein
MYKFQIRPPMGRPLTTLHSSPYQTSSQPNQRRPLHFVKVLTFRFNFKSAVLPLVAFILSIILSGCGGLVWNPGVLGSITPTPGTVKFGPVLLGQKASTRVALANQSSSPITISKIDVSGPSFSLDQGTALPLTLAAGSTLSVNVHFVPDATGAQTGKVTIASNSTTSPKAVVALTGTGSTSNSPALSAISCGTQSLAALQTKACSVYLNAPAADPFVVYLKSNNAAVVVPTAVTIGIGATTTGFNTITSAINTAQSVTLTANAGGVSQTTNIQLNPGPSQPTSGHEVKLTWYLPNSPADPIVGFHVYRSGGSTPTYRLVDSVIATKTAYSDLTVQSGLTYNYVLKSVDDGGVESAPSNMTSVTVP